MSQVELTREQVKQLEGLKFWIREKHILQNFSKPTDEAEKSITYNFEQCDDLAIPKWVQTVVANSDVHSDILDVLNEHNIARKK